MNERELTEVFDTLNNLNGALAVAGSDLTCCFYPDVNEQDIQKLDKFHGYEGFHHPVLGESYVAIWDNGQNLTYPLGYLNVTGESAFGVLLDTVEYIDESGWR